MTIPMTTDRMQEFTPASLLKRDADGKPLRKQPIVFYLRVPTWQERDDINLKLYRYGVRQVSTDAVRAVMISEWFRVKGDAAEEDAQFLDGYWQLAQHHEAAVAAWELKELQRIADIDAGSHDPAEPEPEPKLPMSLRDRARAQRLTQEIIDSSETVRSRLADQHEYSRRFADLCARMEIAGWTGLKAPTSIDESDVMTADCVEALRSELHPLSSRAWTELCTEAQLMFELPPGEMGNFDSPLENISTADGSPLPLGASETSDGPSTRTGAGSTSNTAPTRAGASRKSTAASSESMPGSAAPRKKSGRTGAA